MGNGTFNDCGHVEPDLTSGTTYDAQAMDSQAPVQLALISMFEEAITLPGLSLFGVSMRTYVQDLLARQRCASTTPTSSLPGTLPLLGTAGPGTCLLGLISNATTTLLCSFNVCFRMCLERHCIIASVWRSFVLTSPRVTAIRQTRDLALNGFTMYDFDLASQHFSV